MSYETFAHVRLIEVEQKQYFDEGVKENKVFSVLNKIRQKTG